jgi:hypothetical protein
MDRIPMRSKQFIEILRDLIKLRSDDIECLDKNKDSLSTIYKNHKKIDDVKENKDEDIDEDEIDQQCDRVWKNIIWVATGQNLHDRLGEIDRNILKLKYSIEVSEQELEEEETSYDYESRQYNDSTNNGEYTDDETIHNRCVDETIHNRCVCYYWDN